MIPQRTTPAPRWLPLSLTALAYLAGTATGSDGKQYLLQADMRAMQGRYVAEDGSRQRGLFAFI